MRSAETIVTDPTTGAQKGVKPERYDLMPWPALDEVARVYGYGTTKYPENNWRRGYRWTLSAGAAARHIALWFAGFDIDADSGCHHLAHVAWHCLTLITFAQQQRGTDDRP